MTTDAWVKWLRKANGRATSARLDMAQYDPGRVSQNAREGFDMKVEVALAQLDAKLASAYRQAATDIASDERQSWAGISHEMREILRGIIDILAPKSQVVDQPWYVQNAESAGPTMKQKVRYILERQGVGSKGDEVARATADMLRTTETISRATYDRASDAAHRFKDRREASRILRYLNAIAYDLLNLE